MAVVRQRLGLLLVFALLGGACAPRARAAAAKPLDATVERITTADGLGLDARLFAGDPRRIVIALHGYDEGQEAWFGTADWLRGLGYSVLTLDFRGYGASDGDRQAEDLEADTTAALQFVQERGYTDVALMGGSMGAAAAIATAAREPSVDGVIALSAPTRFADLDVEAAAAELERPLLLAAARGDTSSAESLEVIAHRARLDASDVARVDGSAIGRQLLDAPEGGDLRAHVSLFLANVIGTSAVRP